METIAGAIFHYDLGNRLLPRTPLPPGGERIVGFLCRPDQDRENAEHDAAAVG
jgi:hypothetical protein